MYLSPTNALTLGSCICIGQINCIRSINIRSLLRLARKSLRRWNIFQDELRASGHAMRSLLTSPFDWGKLDRRAPKPKNLLVSNITIPRNLTGHAVIQNTVGHVRSWAVHWCEKPTGILLLSINGIWSVSTDANVLPRLCACPSVRRVDSVPVGKLLQLFGVSCWCFFSSLIPRT